MTKKDYIIIAEALKNVKPYDKYSLENEPYNVQVEEMFLDVVDSIAEKLEKDNPRFNRAVFNGYIGV